MTEMVRAKSQNISFMNIILIYSWNHVRKYMRDLTPYFIWLLEGKWEGPELQHKESYAEKEFRNSQREEEKRHRGKIEPEMLLLNVDESFSASFSFALYYETHKRLSSPTTKTRQEKKVFDETTTARIEGSRTNDTPKQQQRSESWGWLTIFSYFLLPNFVTELMGNLQRWDRSVFDLLKGLKPAPNQDSPPRLRAEKFQVSKARCLAHMGTTKKKAHFHSVREP